MSTVLEACLETSIQDYLELEDVATETLQEAVSWRAVALMALERLHAETRRADRAERIIRRVMGQEPWHREENDSD